MLRVLLLEDSPTIRHVQKNVLVKAGFDVIIASDYADGHRILLRHNNNEQRLDAAVVGWPKKPSEASQKFFATICTQEYSSLVIVLLAQIADSSIEQCVASRPNTELLHWHDYRESRSILLSLHEKAQANEVEQVDREVIVEPQIRVLFVDDSVTVRYKFKKLLSEHGYYAETAATVAEGFDKAVSSDFDIAIIDYFMPEANGDVLCRKLAGDQRTSRMTSAIITGTYLDHAIKECLEAGAVECMFKNESEDLFLARINAMSRHIRARKSIEKERMRLGGILQSVGEGVYGVDTEGRISFINPACMNILGIDIERDFIGEYAHKIFHYAEHDGVEISAEDSFLQIAYEQGYSVQARETVFWHRSGSPIQVECTVYPLTIEGEREGSVVAFRDISDRKLLEEELRWQANHDVLTKLLNRRHFEEQLTQEVQKSQRSDELSALLYVDLDRFKYVNDTAGHVAGDQLLMEIAQMLSSRLRTADLLARLGGDEFALILRNVKKDEVESIANAYRKMLEQYMFVYNDKQYKVNGSFGIAMIDSTTESAGEVLANADIACHIAKNEGRNQVHLFVPENDSKQNMDLDLGWSTRIHDALEQGRLVLHSQSIIPIQGIMGELLKGNGEDFKEGLLANLHHEHRHDEILLRLQDPELGIVYPGAFLPTAERFNMMDEIDLWVVNAAFERLAKLQRKGYSGTFAINLSGQTIAKTQIIDVIEQRIIELNLDPSKLLFEITETSAVSNLALANELITRLRTIGCYFALDDFGSGFSSFSHLKHLPVDYIKIDGLFVRGVATDSSDRAIVKSINNIAHSLGKKTIAEYVENREILKYLIDCGVDYAQGFYIGEPTELSDATLHFGDGSDEVVTDVGEQFAEYAEEQTKHAQTK